jgi:threonine synthase
MKTDHDQGGGVIERYREFLPISDSTPVVSLGEGDTPLVYSARLSARVGRGCKVFVKNEGVNPTGSFKDRGMTVAVSKALEGKARALICASTGNTSASAAAYAARAAIPCVVILPAGKIASGKLVQAFACGAKIVPIKGNFDDALRIVRELGERNDFAIVNSINPGRVAGQKTAAFEIVEALGDAPDFQLLPLGNAGNITAYWAGYREYHARERSTKLPAMIGFKPPVRHRFFTAKLSWSRRRLPRPFGSAIPRAGNKRGSQSMNQVEPSMLSQTKRLSVRKCGWRRMKEFSSSRPAPRRLPDYSNAATRKKPRIHFRKSRRLAGSFAPLPDMV